MATIKNFLTKEIILDYTSMAKHMGTPLNIHQLSKLLGISYPVTYRHILDLKQQKKVKLEKTDSNKQEIIPAEKIFFESDKLRKQLDNWKEYKKQIEEQYVAEKERERKMMNKIKSILKL